MNKRRRLILIAVAFLLLVAVVALIAWAWPDSHTDEISVEQATHLLNRAVGYAQSHDLDGLCKLGSSTGMCEPQWRAAGEWAGVPEEPPEIVDTYLVPGRKFKNGMNQLGGRVLVLSGIDGLGKPYRTEMLVFGGGWPSGLKAANVIYWCGASLPRFNEDGSVSTGQ